jgi:predicted DNA-binding transcriptional regulator YafY
MAEQLGTPLRAVYRDLEVLQSLPAPLFTDRNGKESYWKLDPDYRSKLTVPFTLSEVLSLYLAQDSLQPLEGTVFSDSLQSLFEKLWAVLPKPLFREMVSLRRSFLSGLPAQKEYRIYREFIETIHSAIQAHQTLRLQYEPLNKEPTDRTVDPYAVHLRNGNLYLIGYCHIRKGSERF